MKNNVFTLICFLGLSLLANNSFSQEDKSTRPSPPAVATGKVDDLQITINYSSPSVKGRTIWGGLVPYGKVWRTGANEATTFEMDKDMVINDMKILAGKYALFTIPGEKEWTFIFNKVWDQWGAFKYDESEDALRVTAVPKPSGVFHEKMLFEVKDHQVILYWENLSVALNVHR